MDTAGVADTNVSENPERHEAAAEIITSAMGWSAAAGAVPVPILDIAALAVVQTRMVMDLTELYGERLGQQSARALVSILLGTIIPGALTGGIVGSVVKSAPFVGTLVGMGSLAALGAAATYAIGKVFVRHFEGGGTLATFDAKSIKSELKAEFEKAKAKL